MDLSTLPELRPTWAEISRAALMQNLRAVHGIMGANVGVVAMIKADAYGHGATTIAAWLTENSVTASGGVTALGVATIEEGIELRTHGITQPILVMGGLMGAGDAAARAVLHYDLTPVLHTPGSIALFDVAARTQKRTANFHLKIDSGMSRLGARVEQLAACLDAVESARNVRLTGVMSHYADAFDSASQAAQAEVFTHAATQIRARVSTPLIWHIANSSAILAHASGMHANVRFNVPSPFRGEGQGEGESAPSHITLPPPSPLQGGGVLRNENFSVTPALPFAIATTDQWWVRPGIMLYGIAPCAEQRMFAELHPTMRWQSRVSLVKSIPIGARVSYGGIWRAERATRIAIVPVGYADGYPWSAHTRAHVIVQNRRVPVVGRITMDMIACDITACPSANVGDTVTLLGVSGDDAQATITADELAAWSETFSYEIICRVSKRVPRHYIG